MYHHWNVLVPKSRKALPNIIKKRTQRFIQKPPFHPKPATIPWRSKPFRRWKPSDVEYAIKKIACLGIKTSFDETFHMGRKGRSPTTLYKCGCKNQPLRYATFKIYISSKNSTIDIWRYFDCRPLSKNFLISEGKNFCTLTRTQVVNRRYFASLKESGRNEKSSESREMVISIVVIYCNLQEKMDC